MTMLRRKKVLDRTNNYEYDDEDVDGDNFVANGDGNRYGGDAGDNIGDW